jgi:hypothetical protein
MPRATQNPNRDAGEPTLADVLDVIQQQSETLADLGTRMEASEQFQNDVIAQLQGEGDNEGEDQLTDEQIDALVEAGQLDDDGAGTYSARSAVRSRSKPCQRPVMVLTACKAGQWLVCTAVPRHALRTHPLHHAVGRRAEAVAGAAPTSVVRLESDVSPAHCRPRHHAGSIQHPALAE